MPLFLVVILILVGLAILTGFAVWIHDEVRTRLVRGRDSSLAENIRVHIELNQHLKNDGAALERDFANSVGDERKKIADNLVTHTRELKRAQRVLNDLRQQQRRYNRERLDVQRHMHEPLFRIWAFLQPRSAAYIRRGPVNESDLEAQNSTASDTDPGS